MMCKIVLCVKIYIDFLLLCLYRNCSQNRKALTFCLLLYLISHLCRPLLHTHVLCLLSGFGKGWLLATSSRSFVELQVMDNGVGDPAATLVVVGSVVGGRERGRTCFGWRLPSESLQLFPLGFTHRKVALFFKKNIFFLLWQRLPQVI